MRVKPHRGTRATVRTLKSTEKERTVLLMFKAIISDYFDDPICIIEFKKFTKDFFHTLTEQTYLNTVPVYDELHDINTGGCSCKITNNDKWVCNIETWFLPHKGITKVLVSSPKNIMTTIREIKEI